jgi:hypothetical protein
MKTILFFTSEENFIFKNYFENSKNFSLKIFKIKDEEITNLFKIFIEENTELNDIYFASNNLEYLVIAFRLYNQTFDSFIYLSNEKNSKFEYKFHQLSEISIKPEENITTSLYILGEKPRIRIGINFEQIKNINEIKIRKKNKKIQKVFYFENKFLITEFINFDYKIIYLDKSVSKKDLELNQFFSNLDNHLIKHSEYLLSLFKGLTKNIFSVLNKMKVILDNLSQNEQEKFLIHFKFLINNLKNENVKSYLSSFLVSLKFFNSEMFNSLIEEIKNNNLLTTQNKYFLFWQYTRLDFIKPREKKANQEFFWALYKNIYLSYKNLFQDIEFIPKEQRNKNLILIFTNQFLSELHAPTKLILHRAYHLIKDFNKEILIINTSDLLTKNGVLNFYNCIVGNKLEQYSAINQIPFKDISIPFYQSAIDMPNENEMLNIISIIKEYKPYFILSIGSANLTADLCSNLVTNISFPATSDLAISEAQIHINRTELNKKELRLIKDLNITPESVIVSHPKVEALNSKISYSRNDFKLPNDKFLLSIVGNRLTDEITDEFLIMLLDTLQYNTYLVFIGSFETYEKYCQKYQKLKNNSTLLPFQEHLYDTMKLFDLFVNPGRVGGAHGAWYTIMHEIPVVTLNYGDIHTMTKGVFSCDSINNMKIEIIKHATLPKYYADKSILTKNIIVENTSIKSELFDILTMVNNNNNFN